MIGCLGLDRSIPVAILLAYAVLAASPDLRLATPTLFPRYVLTLVGFFPFTPGPASLVLSWSVFLSYEVRRNEL
jgi:hypothetical protein